MSRELKIKNIGDLLEIEKIASHISATTETLKENQQHLPTARRSKQSRIDSYFKSSIMNFNIAHNVNSYGKRLFEKTDTSGKKRQTKSRTVAKKRAKLKTIVEFIDLCSDSDDNLLTTVTQKTAHLVCEDVKDQFVKMTTATSVCLEPACLDFGVPANESKLLLPCKRQRLQHISKKKISVAQQKDIKFIVPALLGEPRQPNAFEDPGITWSGARSKRTRLCPPYKRVSGTSFAVDAFQFGRIEGITHYFLTHFHADHYVGLSGKFEMPLYLSAITGRLVRAFIPVKEKYLHHMLLNETLVINNVEVTAIDANHCPGAVMFVFKLPCGRCILHTGDFRACSQMESEPIFWNNDMHTIYLDTTYISSNYAFCDQTESIARAKTLIRDFQLKHATKNILYVCGAYIIGKEKFWSALAHEFNLRIWTETNRKKALDVMQLPELKGIYCDNPLKAQMHVIAIGKVNYAALMEYFQPPLSDTYEILLALRPSGWEKNTRPQYRGRINIIGIEYSEHSSNAEMKRFVSYLNPRQVISTVPIVSNDPVNTAPIPAKWYNYKKLTPSRSFQPTLCSYLAQSKPTSLAARSVSLATVEQISPQISMTQGVLTKSSKILNASSDQQPAVRRFGRENFPTHKETPKDQTISYAKTSKSTIYDVNADADDDWLS